MQDRLLPQEPRHQEGGEARRPPRMQMPQMPEGEREAESLQEATGGRLSHVRPHYGPRHHQEPRRPSLAVTEPLQDSYQEGRDHRSDTQSSAD